MYKHTTKDIEKATGLSQTFLRKCITRFKKYLKPSKGERNSFLFDDNAFVVFQKIGEKKKEGLTLPEIEKFLEKNLGSITGDNTANTGGHAGGKTGSQTWSDRGQNWEANYQNTPKIKDSEIDQLKRELFEQERKTLEKEKEIVRIKEENIKIREEKSEEILDLKGKILLLEAPKQPDSVFKKGWWIAWLLLLAMVLGGIFAWFEIGQEWWELMKFRP